MDRNSKRRRIGGAAFSLGLLLLGAAPQARAADIDLPVPSAVVYPGQTVADKVLTTVKFKVPAGKLSAYVIEQEMLTDRIARRTLLPNRPILVSDLKSPDLVRAGVPTAIFYREGGVFISAKATPLTSGGEGDSVRMRNTESGVTISGIVQADGSIEVAAQ